MTRRHLAAAVLDQQSTIRTVFRPQIGPQPAGEREGTRDPDQFDRELRMLADKLNQTLVSE